MLDDNVIDGISETSKPLGAWSERCLFPPAAQFFLSRRRFLIYDRQRRTFRFG
jgi:hypothetical protein